MSRRISKEPTSPFSFIGQVHIQKSNKKITKLCQTLLCRQYFTIYLHGQSYQIKTDRN